MTIDDLEQYKQVAREYRGTSASAAIIGLIGRIEKSRLSSALDDVRAERARHLGEEGWTLEHDDQHDLGEMSRAAACYALQATLDNHISDDALPVTWPRQWDAAWWKPTTRRRNLIKAAALIVAEIERLDRTP